MKKVLILSGSPRRGGNSETLCGEFMKGVKEGGNQAEMVRVCEKKIGYCTACDFCKGHNGECAKKDDMAEVLEKMLSADVIVLASPVYFYSIDAQLKTVIDRTVARWLEFKNKEFYYIITAAEDSKSAMECTLECMRGMAACFQGSVEKGVIFGGGVYQKGEVENTKTMKTAYNAGRKV